MTACGGGGSGGDLSSADLQPAGTDGARDQNTPLAEQPAPGTVPEINTYAGASNIAGTVALSSLSGADADSLDSSAAQQPKIALFSSRPVTRATTASADNAIVKLYAVGGNGVLEETGIPCHFLDEKDAQDNPKYSCEGVADGKSYVVKYLRILPGNKALEMKVNVDIPTGQTQAPAEPVSPESTVVVDTIVNAILTATEGKEIDPDIVEDIIGSVKTVVKNLIDSGAVQVPSMMVEAPKDEHGDFIGNAADLETKQNIAFASNDKLDTTTGGLLSRDDVAQEVDAVKVEIQVRELSKIDVQGDVGKKRLIAKIFDKLIDDGDVPEFIVDFFAKQFSQGVEVDVARLYHAIVAGLRVRPELGVDINTWNLQPEDAASKLRALLADIYTLQHKQADGSLNELDKKKLAEIPGIVPAVFKAADWEGKPIDATTRFNVPQGIVFTIFVTDKLIPELFAEYTGKSLTGIVTIDDQSEGTGPRDIKFDHPVDFDPMVFDASGNQPGLLQLFGFFKPEYLSSLQGVEVGHLELNPERIWLPDDGTSSDGQTSGREYDNLRPFVCVSELSSLAAKMDSTSSAPASEQLRVELEYPSKDGSRRVITLQNEQAIYQGPMPVTSTTDGMPAPFPEGTPEEGEEPGFEQCFTYDPWMQARNTAGGEDMPTPQMLISDFVTGDYGVKVKNSAGQLLAERGFKKKVIIGMQDVVPRLTAPNGMPQWPVECRSTSYCPQWDQIQQKWQAAGGNTTFPLNAESNSKAKVTFNWERPTVALPEGVKITYGLNVAKSEGCNTQEGCRWEQIYSSGENGKRLFGLSFTLPKLLDKLEAQDGGHYNANLCAEFIDTETGEYLGSGGCGFAEFFVGAPLDMSATFTISGLAPTGLDAAWKVALISESYTPDAASEQPIEPSRKTLSLSGIDPEGIYSLSATLGDFLNQSPATHYAIVLFRDENGNDQVDVSADRGEPQFWPDWRDSVYFDTWGGSLRVVREESRIEEGGAKDEAPERKETVIVGGETVSGPDFSLLLNDPRFSPQDYGVTPDSGPAVGSAF